MFKSLYRSQSHPDRRLNETVMNGKGVIVTVIILILYQTVIADGLGYALVWFNQVMGTSFGMVELNLAVELFTMALLVFFFGRFYWENLVTFFREFKAVYIWAPLACYAISMAGNMVVQIILMMIRGESQSTSNNDAINDMLVQSPLQVILITVILAPILEETIFRAGLCRSLTSNKNYFVKAIGFIISVSIFAFMHVYQFAFFATDASGAVYLTFNANEFLSILSYLPMSIALAVCSYLCKNFWGSVICHMLTNGIAVTLMLLMSLMEHI